MWHLLPLSTVFVKNYRGCDEYRRLNSAAEGRLSGQCDGRAARNAGQAALLSKAYEQGIEVRLYLGDAVRDYVNSPDDLQKPIHK